MQHLLSSAIVFILISLATSKPLHNRGKRDVGDIVAAASGILNEKDVPLANCKKIKDECGYTDSGLYKLDLGDDKGEFTVFCDMTVDSGGWTVIQRRVDNSTSFNRNRKEYNTGFGKYDGNFWLGLEKIKRITDYEGQTFELYIGLESFLVAPSDLAWAKYSSFSLDTDANDYKLSVGTYSGTAGDDLDKHHNQKFSTPDEDNDASFSHCGQTHSSGWWFEDCHDANLNGIYYWDGTHPGTPTVYDGILWESWLGNTNSLKTVVMAVRPTT